AETIRTLVFSLSLLALPTSPAGSTLASTRSSEEAIEEVLKRSLVALTARASPPAHILNRGLGIDVDHARLHGLRNLREGVRHLPWRRHRQWSGAGRR